MSFRELPFKRTPLTHAMVVTELLLAWPDTDPVTQAAVRAAAAQIAFESGMTRCYNWLISGIKAKPNNGRTHWQYLTTHERLTPSAVEYAKQLAPGTIDIVETGADGLLTVRVKPKHPYCCFRAYETLAEAVRDHIATLQRGFPRSWAACQTGDVKAFISALKKERYFTGKEADYQAGTAKRLAELASELPPDHAMWGDVL